jgi:hypothetical protein
MPGRLEFLAQNRACANRRERPRANPGIAPQALARTAAIGQTAFVHIFPPEAPDVRNRFPARAEEIS